MAELSTNPFGLSLPLRLIPPATFIHCIEIEPGKGGQLARSAGTYVQVVGRDKGMGLGLWLCRHIVMRHGGKIWHQDRSGGGAEFILFLPS